MENKTYIPMHDYIQSAIEKIDGKEMVKKYTTILDEEEYIELDKLLDLVDSLNYALGIAGEEIDKLNCQIWNKD